LVSATERILAEATVTLKNFDTLNGSFNNPRGRCGRQLLCTPRLNASLLKLREGLVGSANLFLSETLDLQYRKPCMC